jgi:hypothetical protein
MVITRRQVLPDGTLAYMFSDTVVTMNGSDANPSRCTAVR